MTNTAEMEAIVGKYLSQNAEALRKLLSQTSVIVKIANSFVDTLQRGKKILLFGNGGSAADAQHIAAELVGRFRMERKGLPAIALTTNTSCLTSIGNDYGFDEIFSRQIEALGNKGDLAVGITTKGTSKNVLRGIELAKKKGLATIGFAGGQGGSLKDIVDLIFVAPAQETSHIQEIHITVGHIVCHLTELKLFG